MIQFDRSALFALIFAIPAAASAGPVDYARDVQPILQKHCYECHGEKKQKSELRLDIKERAMKGGEAHGPAIIPGEARESPLTLLVTSMDEDERMPSEGEALSIAEMKILIQWIDEGAVWPDGVDPVKGDTKKKTSLMEVPAIQSSWDDLLSDVKTQDDWHQRRAELKKSYLKLIRDQFKPEKPELALKVHETVEVDGVYLRSLISYQVEADERAHAYLGVPLKLEGKAPAIVALHGTYEKGKQRAAGLIDNPDKAYLDHLCRRAYVVIAPEHFVSGHRVPPEGPYDTTRFYEKHPEWTAVGKFTYEHSIAIDVLQQMKEVDGSNIGVLGHSLGGHGTFFLAAYDERIKAAAANCAASFFRHNPKVEAWARDHWYVYFKHIRPGLLKGELPPIGFHEIISLIAPRAFMDLSGLNDGRPGTQRQRVLMLTKLMDVWELEKAPQNFAFYVHGRGHSVAHESRQLMYGWMDTHLKPPAVTETHLVTEKK